MRCVILESPYAGETEANVIYARQCVVDCLVRGEAPIASHLLYTQEGIFDDANESQRSLGIAAGLAWLPYADAMVVYIDRGISKGMIAAMLEASRNRDFPIEIRTLGD